jgi:hypothetical protein
MATRVFRSAGILHSSASLGILSSCSFSSKEISEDMQLSKSTVDKWQAETPVQDNHGEYTDVCLVEFANEDTLNSE